MARSLSQFFLRRVPLISFPSVAIFKSPRQARVMGKSASRNTGRGLQHLTLRCFASLCLFLAHLQQCISGPPFARRVRARRVGSNAPALYRQVDDAVLVLYIHASVLGASTCRSKRRNTALMNGPQGNIPDLQPSIALPLQQGGESR
ncbi:hypothetical protein EJ04DRAFT_519384 [Polyplosphaeria fusca]|uniref:Uncharacterized protein n=1 Tax=Polyplosphaeria fusca TaxID=682080 RepID=A0A9P4V8Q1_9PLEO|nr:hypothetical protein EJ04DRAFT_519384 [Polyplosphaeria fusca]